MKKYQDLMRNILTECEEWSSGPTCLVQDHLLVLSNLGGGGGGEVSGRTMIFISLKFNFLSYKPS